MTGRTGTGIERVEVTGSGASGVHCKPLRLPRIVTGLWQMADQERDGRLFDLDEAARDLAKYARDGFDAFDMADHYGSSEIVAGRAAALLDERPVLMTKWVPEPGAMSAELAREAVMRALDRLQSERVDLFQFHWWSYTHPGYIDAIAALSELRDEGLIGHLGLTNFDTAHLRLLVRHGFDIATNQVCFSLLDRRAAGEMSDFCLESGVRVLAFGTLAGGYLSERWLGRADEEPSDWSKMKYRRFIEAAGGWEPFQTLLRELDAVARRHGVSIANVASRWVLDHEAVASVIVGARLGENEHRSDNRRILELRLDEEDRERIDHALAAMQAIPGDCGDEY
ncbi:MAG: aldo/keto reductase [Geminicoccaceae bacterium]